MLNRMFEKFVSKAIDWWFRVTSIERFLISSAFAALVAIYGGLPLIAVILRMAFGAVPDEYLDFQKTIDMVDGIILSICALVIVVALGIAVIRFFSEARSLTRKKIILVEARGLRDDDGIALKDVASKQLQGHVIPVLLDLRNRMDGKIIEPRRALDEIAATYRSVLQYKSDADRSDITVAYGGLTSVPYTFYTGILFDDEGEIKTFDWDRVQEIWRPLDYEDDDKKFEVVGLDRVSGVKEIVIAVEFSYAINDEDIQSTFSNPTIKLSLHEKSSDAHWSQRKQNRLAQQFLEVVKQCSEAGVIRIHLIMAAPNSVVFTFGRRYDKRNLPELIVYQYERGNTPTYPWGILMPVANVERAQVLDTGRS